MQSFKEPNPLGDPLSKLRRFHGTCSPALGMKANATLGFCKGSELYVNVRSKEIELWSGNSMPFEQWYDFVRDETRVRGFPCCGISMTKPAPRSELGLFPQEGKKHGSDSATTRTQGQERIAEGTSKTERLGEDLEEIEEVFRVNRKAVGG